MGVNPTPTNYKTFTFGGTNSRSYGVYITGQGVFNAPERNVEMVEIPGRNGAYALDKGNFNNIEVTYPAGIFADTETDFAQAVSDLRNLLCSKVGYVRLEDDYNPNEYRLAIYKSGLEVSHDMLIAGEFDIVFECKPQRFLTSGETAVSVASGGTITNPTLFDAKPLLELTGYGDITFNGRTISLVDDIVGNVQVQNDYVGLYTSEYSLNFPEVYINANDDIYVGGSTGVYMVFKVRAIGSNVNSASVSNVSGYSQYSPAPHIEGDGQYGNIVYCWVEIPFIPKVMTFNYGTPKTNKENFNLTLANTDSDTMTYSIECGIEYDGLKSIRFYMSGLPNDLTFELIPGASFIGGIKTVIHSTATTYGNPTYIDCDIGEAYANNGGVISPLNKYVALGSELPTFAPGANTITYDNTFTSVKVTPRWWKV